MSYDRYSLSKIATDFYSSQINTHGRLIMGLSVLILAIVQIRQRMFSPLWYQYGIVYSAVWLTFFGLWFSLMRLVAYGVAINAVVHYKVDDSISSPSEVVNKAVSGAIDGGEKVLFLIPLKWFMRRGYQRWGAVICIIIAIVTTWFLWLLEPFV